MAKELLIEFRKLVGGTCTNQEAEHWRHYWHNWSGVVPEKGDVVLLHFGDDNEQEERFVVCGRAISGTEPNKVVVFVDNEQCYLNDFFQYLGSDFGK